MDNNEKDTNLRNEEADFKIDDSIETPEEKKDVTETPEAEEIQKSETLKPIETPEERHLRHEKEREERKKKRRTTRAIVSGLLALIIFLVSFIGSIYYGLYSRESLERAFVKSDYVNEAYKTAHERIEALTLKSGLPVEVFDGIVTLEQVSVHVSLYIESIALIDVSDLSTGVIGTTIKKNTENYVISQNKEISGDVKSRISAYAEECEKIYKECIISEQLEFFKSMKMVVLVIGIILIPVSIAGFVFFSFIISINVRRTHQLLRYYSWATGAAGIVMLIPSGIAYLVKFYEKFGGGVDTMYKYLFISDYLHSLCANMLYMAIILILIQFVCLGLWTYIVAGKKRKKRRRHSSYSY